MDKTVRQLWIDELRKTKLKQGYARLGTTADSNEDGIARRCCLGILCDLAVEAGVIPAPTERHGALTYGLGGSEEPWISELGLPIPVLRWSGLALAEPHTSRQYATTSGQHSSSLSSLNDSEEYPFARIADIIEHDPAFLSAEEEEVVPA